MQALERLKGVYNIADDILITGEGPTMNAAREDNDRNLLELIKKCQATGIRLNKDKLRLPVWLTAEIFRMSDRGDLYGQHIISTRAEI